MSNVVALFAKPDHYAEGQRQARQLLNWLERDYAEIEVLHDELKVVSTFEAGKWDSQRAGALRSEINRRCAARRRIRKLLRDLATEEMEKGNADANIGFGPIQEVRDGAMGAMFERLMD